VVTLTVKGRSGVEAGASIDVLGKETVLGDLDPLTSIAYLQSLKRLYSAELSAVGSAAARPAQSAAGTWINEITLPEGEHIPMMFLDGLEISDMIPYADQGQGCLLLLSKSTGSVIRWDPRAPSLRDQVFPLPGGDDVPLQEPEAMVLDPFSGDL